MTSWMLFRRFLLGRRAGTLVRTLSILSVISVTLGVAALITVLSVMSGLGDSVRRRLLAAEPHLIVTGADASAVQAVLAQTEVTGKVFEFEERDVVLRTSDGVFGGAIARSLPLEGRFHLASSLYQASLQENPDTQVKKPALDDVRLKSGQIMVGIDLARSLHIFEGDRIAVLSPDALLLPPGEVPPLLQMEVIGFLITDVAELDASLILTEPQALHRLGGSSLKTGAEIHLDDPQNTDRVSEALSRQSAAVARINLGKDLAVSLQAGPVKIETWADRNRSLFFALKLEKFATGIFLSLAALIGGFSVVTVLSVLIAHKRRELGLFVALGLTEIRARKLFMGVGLWLGGLATLTGLILGVFLSTVLQFWKHSILPEFYYDTTLPARLDPGLVLVVGAVAMLLVAIGAWAPTKIVGQIPPAQLIKSKLQTPAGHR